MPQGQKGLLKRVEAARKFYGDEKICTWLNYRSNNAVKQWIVRERIPLRMVPNVKLLLEEIMTDKYKKQYIKKKMGRLHGNH